MTNTVKKRDEEKSEENECAGGRQAAEAPG